MAFRVSTMLFVDGRNVTSVSLGFLSQVRYWSFLTVSYMKRLSGVLSKG